MLWPNKRLLFSFFLPKRTFWDLYLNCDTVLKLTAAGCFMLQSLFKCTSWNCWNPFLWYYFKLSSFPFIKGQKCRIKPELININLLTSSSLSSKVLQISKKQLFIVWIHNVHQIQFNPFSQHLSVLTAGVSGGFLNGGMETVVDGQTAAGSSGSASWSLGQ